jgi:serine/threonine protein kinase
MSGEDRFLEYAGAFRLVRKVAVGGMATVYEAEQLGPAGFAKRIALKVIHPQYAEQREWLQLFIDEAKLSANLMHGNIVQIYQLGEVSGEFFIAMEFIQGPTLRSIIDRHWELGQPIGRSTSRTTSWGWTSGDSTSCIGMCRLATSWRAGTGTSNSRTLGSRRHGRRLIRRRGGRCSWGRSTT